MGQFFLYYWYYINIFVFFFKECGYFGFFFYWDEICDVGKFFFSFVFDFVIGFGGIGKGLKNCVVDGFFVNFIVNIGLGFKL